jgi:hypothetical protein
MRKDAIERRLKALECLRTNNYGQLDDFTRVAGVSRNFATVVSGMGIVKKEDKVYKWNTDEQPSLSMARRVLSREQEYVKKYKAPQAFTPIDNIIKWVEIGIRYGVSDIKSFVKEVIK